MKCNTCGQGFDPGNLTSVMVHEHNEDINPALAIGIKGERIPKTLLEIQNEVDNTQKTTVTLNNEKAI